MADPSVRLSNAGIVTKRMDLSSHCLQWLKWSCEAGAHLTKPGWSKPHTHSPPN